MAIAIVSGRITTIRSAQPNEPTFGDGNANFTCTGMHCEGVVRLNGLPADSRDGWRIGWVQAQWIETNWGDYRGQFDRDGSIFIQRARPPARLQQGCRDTSGPVGDIFTDPNDVRELKPISNGPFPINVAVESNDPPGESYPLILQNSKAHLKPNFLHEVQLEFHFCTVLTVLEPPSTFHHLASFYWNVHWQYRFHPQVFPNPTDDQWRKPFKVADGTSGNASGSIPGTPTDRRFSGVLTTPQAFSCVDIATVATAKQRVDEFPRWASPDVRR
jgi:hypothetical protein